VAPGLIRVSIGSVNIAFLSLGVTPVSVSGGPGAPLVGNSAEWIVERPLVTEGLLLRLRIILL
jgi:hypothetical protein